MSSEHWGSLSREEKFEERFKSWMDPEKIDFNTEEARNSFMERTRIIKESVELKTPERIPVCPKVSFFPVRYAGFTIEEVMFDFDKMWKAWLDFHQDFDPDSLSSPSIVAPGRVLEILDYKHYKWPGHGVAPDVTYQFKQAEYMLDHEYDLFITDPTRFWINSYLPRVCGALQSLHNISPFTDMVELPMTGKFFSSFGDAGIQDSLEKLVEAGQIALEWMNTVRAVNKEITASKGAPVFWGGFSKAPFDTLGDTLRGTQKIMLDIFRQPEKLIEAMEKLVPINVELGCRSATERNTPFVFMPLHQGSDEFISDREFAKFYWPTLKKVILGLIDEGLVPLLKVQGNYYNRIEYLNDPDIPAGKTVWFLQWNEIERAREVLEGKACIAGSIPNSLLKAGTPAQMEEYVKGLINNFGRDGGFILSSGVSVDDARPENFKAFMNTGYKHGRMRD